MKFLGLLSVLCISLLALIVNCDEENVLTLNKDNFDKAIEENEAILVEFYAPWCGHCKNLAPKYEAAGSELKGTGAVLAKVDCTVENTICQKFEVKGYPTLKVFRNQKPSDYNSGRETEAIVSFMKKQLLPALSIINEEEKIKEFTGSDRVVIFGFFESNESPEFKLFSSIADSLRDEYVFGATINKELFSNFGASTPSDIILYKKFDEGKNNFEDDFEEDDILNFIKTNSVPVMDDIGPQNYQLYMESGLPLAYLFVGDEEDRETVGKQVEKVAQQLKGKINFVYIDANQYGGHANNLNLKVGDWPAFSIQDPSKNTKYPFKGEITTEAILAHVQGVLSGEISPSVKSQPIPTEQGPVFTVVGDNYQQVFSQGKDVLIEFYAPWCGHCKKLAPIYEELGKFYEGNENILIAKMDATENDLPINTPFQVEGFPTIKFVKADGTVIDYNGERQLENFKSFIEKNATPRDEAHVHDSHIEKDEL